MIEKEKDTQIALDIDLHIPLPRIKFKITGLFQEKIKNEPLKHTENKEPERGPENPSR